MTKERLSLGEEGELFAARYIKKKGYKIKEQNYRTPLGEIDIIAMDGKTIVFIEVKTRKSVAYGYPFEAVNSHKQKQIIKTAHHYLLKKKYQNRPSRFDVLSLLNKGDSYEAEFIQNAFECSPF